MGSKFFTLTLAAAALAVAASATLPAVAATSTTLKVPFSFAVNGKICPAGYYTVQRDLLASTVRLQSQDASRHFAWIANYDTEKDSDHVILQFDNVGQMHALRSVQSGTLVTRQLDKKNKRMEEVSPETVGQ